MIMPSSKTIMTEKGMAHAGYSGRVDDTFDVVAQGGQCHCVARCLVLLVGLVDFPFRAV